MGRQIDYKHEAIIKQLSSINRKLGTITGDGDSEGEGGDDSSHTVDIMDVTNGASVELLTDPRIYFESLTKFQSYELGGQSLENIDWLNPLNEGQFIGNIRFHSSDEKYDINPFNVSDKPFSDALRISADKMPYVTNLILHRFLPGIEGAYGVFDITYPFVVSLSKLYTVDGHNYEGDDWIYDEENLIGGNGNNHLYTHGAYTAVDIDADIKFYRYAPIFYVKYSYSDTTVDTYEIFFINIDDEVFPNGKKVWIPFVLLNSSGVSQPEIGSI